MSFLSVLFNMLPVSKHKIVFYSFMRGYGDNPRYILEEIVRQRLPYQLVWVGAGHECVPKGIQCVSSKWRTWYEFSTAHVIISNARIGGYFSKGFRKKPGQFYIQTWHGFALKKIERDALHLSPKYLTKAKFDSENIDYLLSNSRFMTNVYRSCFFYDGPILEFGSPRNDPLLRPKKAVRARVREGLHLCAQDRIVLYAPTFRDDRKMDYAPLNVEALQKALKRKFGGTWRVLLRLHPNLLKHHYTAQNDCVLDVSLYPDMTELLMAADVLVTDYSSCMFDFMLQYKPVFVYAPDEEKYCSERGLYFPLTSMPFMIAKDNLQLAHNIASFSAKNYRTRLKRFLDTKKIVEDGCASKRVVGLIKTILS